MESNEIFSQTPLSPENRKWPFIAIPHRTIRQISILFIKQKNRPPCMEQLRLWQTTKGLGQTTTGSCSTSLISINSCPGECLSPWATKTLYNSLRSLISSTISFTSLKFQTKSWMLSRTCGQWNMKIAMAGIETPEEKHLIWPQFLLRSLQYISKIWEFSAIPVNCQQFRQNLY